MNLNVVRYNNLYNIYVIFLSISFSEVVVRFRGYDLQKKKKRNGKKTFYTIRLLSSCIDSCDLFWALFECSSSSLSTECHLNTSNVSCFNYKIVNRSLILHLKLQWSRSYLTISSNPSFFFIALYVSWSAWYLIVLN